jgi:hypothetical protein
MLKMTPLTTTDSYTDPAVEEIPNMDPMPQSAIPGDSDPQNFQEAFSSHRRTDSRTSHATYLDEEQLLHICKYSP